MNKYKNSTRNKIISDIIRLEKEVRFIPIHRETLEELETWTDDRLARYIWQLVELRTRSG
jgi:hypothetical protein